MSKHDADLDMVYLYLHANFLDKGDVKNINKVLLEAIDSLYDNKEK